METFVRQFTDGEQTRSCNKLTILHGVLSSEPVLPSLCISAAWLSMYVLYYCTSPSGGLLFFSCGGMEEQRGFHAALMRSTALKSATVPNLIRCPI